MLGFFCILQSAFASAKTAEPTNEEWQFFRVNAQYRGAVKKGFRDLGCAIGWFKDLADNQVQAILHVCALHPERRNEKYSFRLNLILQRKEGSYSIQKEIYADFVGITGERQNQIRQLVALWAYMRDFARTGEIASSFDAGGARLGLSESVAAGGKKREITCNWPGRKDFSGKFFFKKSVDEKLVVDKFRFKSGKLSVSLAMDTAAAINRDFAYREPFKEVVFK